jgi:hypothetical protein
MKWMLSKFFWGLLVLPLAVVVFSVTEGDFGRPNMGRLILFIILWMAAVLVMMRRFGIWPFRRD